jgi:hypothetical protein
MTLWTRRMKAALCTTLLAGAACGGDPEMISEAADLREVEHLGTTDVTILYPLPDDTTMDHLLGASSEGERGELLPGRLYDQLLAVAAPPTIDASGNEVPVDRPLLEAFESELASLRVLGVRIDPCHAQSSYDYTASCVGQIRLVAQFFTKQGTNRVLDDRASLHLIYEVAQNDFVELVKGLRALRHAAGLPLQKGFPKQVVHPTIREQGIAGDYARSLNELLLRYAGADNLGSIAVAIRDIESGTPNGYYANASNASRWVFSTYAVDDGYLRGVRIPGSEAELQTVNTNTNGFTVRKATFQPELPLDKALAPLFNLPTTEDRTAPLLKAFELLNPERHNTGSADCASCHMAKDGAFIASRTHVTVDASDVEFRSHTFRLDDVDHSALGPFRMFGYAAMNALVSPRVINDTAFSLEIINHGVLR